MRATRVTARERETTDEADTDAAHAPELNTDIAQTHRARPPAAPPTVDDPEQEQAPEPQEQADQTAASAQLHPDQLVRQLGLQDQTSASASREAAGLPPVQAGLEIASHHHHHHHHHPPLSEAVAAAAAAAAFAAAAEAEAAEAGAAAMTHALNAEAGLLRALELLASAGHPSTHARTCARAREPHRRDACTLAPYRRDQWPRARTCPAEMGAHRRVQL